MPIAASAAEAGLLVRADRPGSEDGVYGGAQVPAGDGLIVAGPAVVYLAAVDELALPVEKEKIRSASRGIVPSHGLAFVVAKRENEALFLRETLELVG